jgi:hypothetical protein
MINDFTTIRMTIRKITKKVQILGPDLYDIYVSLPSYRSIDGKKKESDVTYPVACFTSKHTITTQEGHKPIEKVRIGDVIFAEIRTMIG